ncbi:collagen-like triple helix repeat-containing protein, partial [Lactococcus lactis]
KSSEMVIKDGLSVAGHKIESGSTVTPWMLSSSEVTTADWPSYIGQYTDFTQADSTNPSDYTWSLMRGNDGKDGATGPQGPQGNTGPQGPTGPAGSNGNPGKVVSDTEPTTRFKGLTWKYSGTTDLTASDGTVIEPNTEYYYNGTHWMINYLSANNLEANS